MTNLIKGKVVWFDQRDGYGIIKATLGTAVKREVKFYVDISSINQLIKSGDKVMFEWNEEIRDCACAKNVSLI